MSPRGSVCRPRSRRARPSSEGTPPIRLLGGPSRPEAPTADVLDDELLRVVAVRDARLLGELVQAQHQLHRVRGRLLDRLHRLAVDGEPDPLRRPVGRVEVRLARSIGTVTREKSSTSAGSPNGWTPTPTTAPSAARRRRSPRSAPARPRTRSARGRPSSAGRRSRAPRARSGRTAACRAGRSAAPRGRPQPGGSGAARCRCRPARRRRPSAATTRGGGRRAPGTTAPGPRRSGGAAGRSRPRSAPPPGESAARGPAGDRDATASWP